MSDPHFYHPSLTESDTVCELSPQESRHALASRRLAVGQTVKLINGEGLIASGEICEVNKHQVSVSIDSTVQRDNASRQTIVFTAQPKGDRQRFMVEGLTQLGVRQIVPIHCDRSNMRLNEKTLLKWQRYAIEACKQSQNPFLPEVTLSIDLADLERFWSQHHSKGRLFYTDAKGQRGFNSVSASQTVGVIIGPEGGFTKLELSLLEKITYDSIRLADDVLRTEIAAITALAQLKL